MTKQVFRTDRGRITREDEAAQCARPLTPAFPIFHWSPVTRRNQIIRRGMMPGSWSTEKMWRPPHTCWSGDPHLAWLLSGNLHPEISEWDLWQTWSDVPSGMETLIDCRRDNGAYYVKEHRVYERIYKRDLWLVATRSI